MPDASRHARQLALPGFGAAAQDALARARVLVIGAGGLGSVLLPQLVGAGLATGPGGRLGIVDDDAIVRELPQIRQAMYAALRTEPRTIVSMRVDRDVETGLLYDVQQELREAEALRVNYSTSREAE